MQSRRRFALVFAATLAVAGAVGFLAPPVSASPSAAGALDNPRPVVPTAGTTGFQPELPPPERWNRTYGSAAGDLVAATIDDRGVVAAGTLLTDSGTSNSGWVVAVDRAGDVRFQETYASDGEGRFTDVARTADGGYLLAGTLDSGNTAADDGWVVKVDATGSVVWQHTFGGAGDDEFTAIQPTDDGFLLAGTVGGGGDSDGWLVKLSPGGQLQWDGSYDNDFDDVVRDIEPHPAGGYLLAGETTAFVGARTDGWTVHVEADGSELAQRTYGGPRADGFQGVETLDGDVILAGESNSYGTEERRGWVLRRGPNGTERWNRTYDVDETDALAVNENGFVLAGVETTNAGIRDGVLLGAGTDGVNRWRRAYGGANDDLFSDVLIGPDGGYLVAGTSFSGPGDGTGWLVALGTVLAVPTPTPTGGTSGTTTTEAAPTTVDGTTTPVASRSTTTVRTTRATGSAVNTGAAGAGGTTTTNASAAGGGGSFPWTIIALLLILAVLGGVIVAIRSQQVGGTFGSGEDDGHAPSPPGGSDPTFGSPPSDESTATDSTASEPTSQPTSRGTPRDPDPLGTNARSPGEAAKLLFASIGTWARVTLPFLDSTREGETSDGADDLDDQIAGPGTDPADTSADSGDPGLPPESPDSDTTAEPAAADATTGAAVGAADESASDAVQTDADPAQEGAGADRSGPDSEGTGAEDSTASTATAGATVQTDDGEPGTFTLRNPGSEEVVVAFRCQTADETLFNYYAEVPPGTIKRARKLPATDRFEITIAITDGPSETRRFQNQGPDGQDVTVTVSPDSIRMEAASARQDADAAIEGTVEPATSTGADDDSDADEDTSSDDVNGADTQESDQQADPAVSDDPDDVLPSVDEDSSDTVVSDDPDDVLPGVDDGDDGDDAEDSEQGRDDADAVEETGTPADGDGGDEATTDSAGGGSGFQALKEEFESGEADWDDESDDSENASDETGDGEPDTDDPLADEDEDLDGLELGKPDQEAEFDDDLGLESDEFEDGLGLADETDDEVDEPFAEDPLDDDFDEEIDEDPLDDDFDEDPLDDDFDDELDDDLDTDLQSDSGETTEEDDDPDESDGDDDGDKSFAELKEEFESGEAEWADEDEE